MFFLLWALKFPHKQSAKYLHLSVLRNTKQTWSLNISTKYAVVSSFAPLFLCQLGCFFTNDKQKIKLTMYWIQQKFNFLTGILFPFLVMWFQFACLRCRKKPSVSKTDIATNSHFYVLLLQIFCHRMTEQIRAKSHKQNLNKILRDLQIMRAFSSIIYNAKCNLFLSVIYTYASDLRCSYSVSPKM